MQPMSYIASPFLEDMALVSDNQELLDEFKQYIQ